MKARFFQFANKGLLIYDVEITLKELLFEFIVNMLYGFAANVMVPFIVLGKDWGVLGSFVMYYYFLSYILNRERYESKFARYVLMPIPCIIGAFFSYKVGYLIAKLF